MINPAIDGIPILDLPTGEAAFYMIAGAFVTVFILMFVELIAEKCRQSKLKKVREHNENYLVMPQRHYPEPLPQITPEQLAECMNKYRKIMEKKPTKRKKKR